MIILQIVLGALVGTSLMTLFSYIVAKTKEKQFREPELLNELLSRAKINFTPSRKSAVGWVLHYLMGIMFVIAYYLFWKISGVDPSLTSGAILGVISGIVGIAIWETIFSVHSNPPRIELKGYYWHLMIAHIIFGFGVALGFLLAG